MTPSEPERDFEPLVQVKVPLQVGATEPWDLSDPLNPQPNVYPVCPDCQAPWHYTWAWLIGKTSTERWCWTRPPGVPKGCKHKGHPVVYDRRTGEVTAMATKGDHVDQERQP
jgi:hypothetical protein